MNRPSKITAAAPCGTTPATMSPEKVVGVTSSTMTCRECDGDGVGKYMALDEMKYVWRECHVCSGTGEEAAYCHRCEAQLVDSYCADCEEYTLIDWNSRQFIAGTVIVDGDGNARIEL